MLLPLSPSPRCIFACWCLFCRCTDQLSCIAPRTGASPSSKNVGPHVRHSRFLVQTTASRMPVLGAVKKPWFGPCFPTTTRSFRCVICSNNCQRQCIYFKLRHFPIQHTVLYKCIIYYYYYYYSTTPVFPVFPFVWS